EDAEYNFQRALAPREKALGTKHKLVAASLSKLAQFYRKSEKTNAADFHFKRALKTYQELWGTRHRGTINILELYASFLIDVGRRNEAEEYRARAKEIRNLESG
ncbi:MAG TPA: tetratricopeptide repeat protein, partial [Alphaproteobacteria bacterium]|nr:tetratricopeptide repeat protein [Alphaproteobacteria bacterium]